MVYLLLLFLNISLLQRKGTIYAVHSKNIKIYRVMVYGHLLQVEKHFIALCWFLCILALLAGRIFSTNL